ncbi:MAG TPA: aminotransferase class I/II-fold pyridoxal phosphate-dependent enzyme [Spirochaetia bacterium]|nr:aminotransferase class I/II-fold pyridoxal phosphate-dependent enzyme [Spirochaetia bacterium]
MSDLKKLQEAYDALKGSGLKLNIERGQPGDDNFDLSNGLLTIVDEHDVRTPSGFDIRNYPGGVKGLPEMRTIAAEILGIAPAETIVGNNASLKLLSGVLTWALLKGLPDSNAPWVKSPSPKMIVAVPGYDRHFTMLHALGFQMEVVNMTGRGPDIETVAKLAAADPEIKGIVFVPTYSNPTGETVADEVVDRLVSMKTAAPDFTVFADDAYAVHHLTNSPRRPKNLLTAARAAGNPHRVILFGSTSKITFAGAGLGFLGASESMIDYLAKLFGTQFIGPNKAEHYRHAKFLGNYPGGVAGLMQAHAALLKPKFDAADAILSRELGGQGLAEWTTPEGGYFISLTTARPIAARVVELAKNAGLSVTPAGATYPFGKDPGNSNIRIAPTRPPLPELEKAMEALTLCIKLASAELEAAGK